VLVLIGFDNGAVIPAAERVLAVEQIAFLKRHSPVKIFGLGLVRRDLKRMPINIDTLVIDIAQVLNFNVGLINSKDFAPAPNKFIILAIGLNNIDHIIRFEGTGPFIVGEFKVVVRLNNPKVT
jgi:hypothetical protein